MKSGEKERYLNYIKRFFNPDIPFRQKWVAFWRYTWMIFGLLDEKIRGVDYEMIYHEDNSNTSYGHYTMSPQKVLKRIFSDTKNIEHKGFLDIGSGKGYAIMLAQKAGFEKAGGVEYNKHLFNNPFKSDILAIVAKNIYDSHKDKKCRCYFLNPNDPKKHEAFIQQGFTLVKVIEDPDESYFTMNVYEN